VADAFAQAWNQHRQVIAAEVVSAAPLDEQQAKALGAALEAQTGGGSSSALASTRRCSAAWR
jgi:F0F1-type ATP synthase delta subunit